jgi:hypothetical protein
MNEVKQPAVKVTEHSDTDRGRVAVREVWFDRPLPTLSQGGPYIGDGDGWKQFKVMADFAQRLMIVTLPDRRTLRVPFENVLSFRCG